MNEKNAFLSGELSFYDQGKSLFQIVPVPYEKTTSYGKGTAKAPKAIIEASVQLEAHVDGFAVQDRGIYTHDLVNCGGTEDEVLRRIEQKVILIGQKGQIPVVLGGEHTVSFPAIKALNSLGKRFGIVHIDAHMDLRDSYEGSSYSHACVMRRASELDIPIVQLGVRAYSLDEQKWAAERGIVVYSASQLVEGNLSKVELPKNFPQAIYLSVDVDGFDPAVFPATGTPVPGGLSWYQGLALIKYCLTGRTLIGFDVVELSPHAGSAASDFAAAVLVQKIMTLSQLEAEKKGVKTSRSRTKP